MNFKNSNGYTRHHELIRIDTEYRKKAIRSVVAMIKKRLQLNITPRTIDLIGRLLDYSGNENQTYDFLFEMVYTKYRHDGQERIERKGDLKKHKNQNGIMPKKH